MAQNINLSIDQGANAQINVSVIHENGDTYDLTGYTANASFRKHYNSANATTFVCTPYANGLIILTMNAETSGAANAGRYVYDIVINHTSSNTTTRIQEGVLTVAPQVT